MAIIPITDQDATGSKQLIELASDTLAVADRWRNMSHWMLATSDLETDPNFLIGTGSGSAASDTVAQILADLDTFMTTNREKIERFYRGA